MNTKCENIWVWTAKAEQRANELGLDERKENTPAQLGFNKLGQYAPEAWVKDGYVKEQTHSTEVKAVMMVTSTGSINSLKADYYESKVFSCSKCEHVTKEQLRKHYSSEKYNECLPCKNSKCKHQITMEELRRAN